MVEVVNKTPVKDAFHFTPITGGLFAAGSYALRFLLSPALPTHPQQSVEMTLSVTAGPASQIVLAVRLLSGLSECCWPELVLTHA